MFDSVDPEEFEDVENDGNEEDEGYKDELAIIDDQILESSNDLNNTESQGYQNEIGMTETSMHGLSFANWLVFSDSTDLLSNLDEEDTSQENSLGAIHGNPTEYADNWHMQENPDTCAIVSQEYIIESITGEELIETDLVNQAIEKGYYSPGCGTYPADVGKLLEDYNIDVERSDGNSMNDIVERLDEGQSIIVGVDAAEIWYNSETEQLNDLFFMPNANHAVQVIGFNDDTDTVILNDPGHPKGEGMEVSRSDFECAWEDSNNFMVYTV